MPRVLVTYATRFGSTREIAEAIAAELTTSGFDVDTLTPHPGIELFKYDAAVVGAPAYGENWLPAASLFVVGNAAELSKMPVALFTVGMMGVKNPKFALKEHERIIDKLKELTPGLEPVSVALFHGSFSRSNLPLCLRIMDFLAGTPKGDHRNWEAIRGWARRLGDTLHERLDESDVSSSGPAEPSTESDN